MFTLVQAMSWPMIRFEMILGAVLTCTLGMRAEAPLDVGSRKQLGIDKAVYWKGRTEVSSLAGKPVRLHVKLTRAKLHGFQFLRESGVKSR
jgi:hypothetical protein